MQEGGQNGGMWKFWVAGGLFLFERGLDLSGFQSIYLSVVLWFASAIFFLVALREYASERSSDSILPKTERNVFKQQLHKALELDEKHKELKEEVEELKTNVAFLMSSEQKVAAAQELSKHEPAGEVEVTSDVSVIDQAVEIVSVLEDGGWDAKASPLDKGKEPPEGITVSGSASAILIDAFRHADLDIKEDSTKKTGRTYIVIGPIKGKKKNDS